MRKLTFRIEGGFEFIEECGLALFADYRRGLGSRNNLPREPLVFEDTVKVVSSVFPVNPGNVSIDTTAVGLSEWLKGYIQRGKTLWACSHFDESAGL